MVYSETTDIKMVDFPAFDLLVISLVVDSFIFILPVDLTDLPKDWFSHFINNEIELVSIQKYMFLILFSGDMLDLLKWRVHPDRIIDCLSKLKDIDGTEIVKV